MTAITENRPAASFIISEANGHRSRANGTGGATLPAGEVVKVSGGELVSYDGSGTVVGIVMEAAADGVPVAYIARDAEVNENLLTSSEVTDGTVQAAAIAGLLTLGIVTRA